MTLLIKGVRILVGNRKFPEPTDVFISGDKISAIGSFPTKPADKVLDGQGGYLAPGFIDMSSETDHYLEIFNHPSQDDFLKQGITTIMGGQEGSSLAPLLYGRLESLEEWTNPDRGNVDWRTVGELLERIDRRKLGVNFGTFVGHSTVRRALLGDLVRDLTKNELAVFSKLLEKALDDGAFGLSVNLKSVYGRKTPYAELKTLAKIVARYRGFFETAMRKAHGLTEAVDEILKLAKETQVTTIVNHLLPIKGQKEDYENALQEIEERGGDRFFFDVSPFEVSIRPLYRFLPDWAQTGSLDEMTKQLRSEWHKPRLLNDFMKVDPATLVVLKAWNNPTIVGYSLRELMDIYGIRKSNDALFHLMETTALRALIAYRNIDERLLPKALAHPRSLVSSKGMSFGKGVVRERMLRLPDAINAFPKFLSLMVQKNLLPLEEAVRKITLLPAQLLKLKDRGEIIEGKTADLVCFKLQADAVEVKFTVMGGQPAVVNGEFQNVFAGKTIRRRTS